MHPVQTTIAPENWPLIAVMVLMIFGLCVAVLVLLRRLSRERHDAKVFRTVAEKTNDGLILQAYDSKILWVNESYCRIMDYAPEELIGRYPLDFVLPPDERVSKKEARAFRFDTEGKDFRQLTQRLNVRRGGELFYNQFSLAVADPGVKEDQSDLLVVLACRDITDQIDRERELGRAHEELFLAAYTDPLTSLANRLALNMRLEALVIDPGPGFAVLHFDLNAFKQINDTFGHAAGDAILRHTAEALKSTAPDNALVCRMGGDEFMVLLPGVTKFMPAARQAITMLKSIAVPVPWLSGQLTCTSSVGIALGEPDRAEETGVDTAEGVGVDTIVDYADVALYKAKSRPRRQIACYDTSLHEQHTRDQQLRDDLAAAVEAQTLTFHFQPKVDARAGRVMGFEALARWTHPERGAISPGTFLPILEEVGLMSEFDILAANATIAMLKKLREAGHSDMSVAMNLSPGSLISDSFANYLIWEIDAHEIDPRHFEVEVLETTFFVEDGGPDPAMRTISRLRQAGLVTMLDDFGVGFAGLSHLARLDVEGLKIDRSLIQHINDDPLSRRIVEAIVSLADDLSLRLIAEGVETREQIAMLLDIGCSEMQGFAYARPMAEDDVLDWLYEHAVRTNDLGLSDGEKPAGEKTRPGGSTASVA